MKKYSFIRFGAVGLIAGVIALTPAAAFAAGSGYTPTGGTGSTATGLPGSVVSSTTIQPSGGSANATIGTATVTATVPSGAFTGPVQLTMTDATGSSVAPPAGSTGVATFGIGFYVNGTKMTGTFPAVTVTVTSPSILAGSTVYFVTGSGLQAVSGAVVKAGSVTFTITSDPTIEVAAPASAATGGAAISGATSAQTGKPFFLEGLLAAALVAFGTLLVIVPRRRRRAA